MKLFLKCGLKGAIDPIIAWNCLQFYSAIALLAFFYSVQSWQGLVNHGQLMVECVTHTKFVKKVQDLKYLILSFFCCCCLWCTG